MDYESVRGKGTSNLSSYHSHRMPTVSAAQALQDLSSSTKRCISTGLPSLDCVLQHREHVLLEGEPLSGGVSRGSVTEIYGPPGVGKTTLGMHLAASVLHAGEGVVWVDGSHTLCGPRISQILTSLRPATTRQPSRHAPQTRQENLDNLRHFSTPTLAHLIALLCHPTANFPEANTSLIVVESLSTLISGAFPRTTSHRSKNLAFNPPSRKLPILQYLINSLQKLAATRNIAVVVTSQCVTKLRPEAGAVIVPSISTTAWEQGLGCRISLFRDWGWEDGGGGAVNDVRFAEVEKSEGIQVSGKRKLVGFAINESGIISIQPRSSQALHSSQPKENVMPLPQKRKLSATGLEIPDSEDDDEDYGWAEQDEENVPAMPPQWQGSEDILIPAEGELEAEDEEVEDGSMSGDGTKMGEVDDSEDELAL